MPMKEENDIRFEPMPEFASNGKQQDIPIYEREYFSLYDELEEKCNPDRYMNPFVQERFDLANELYAELQKRGKRDDKSLVDIRDRAMEGLGIHISTQRLYKYLLEFCNPNIYTSMKPYDKDRVHEAGRLYAMIQNAKDDIHALEAIEKDAEPFIKKRKDEIEWMQKVEEERLEQVKEMQKKDDRESAYIIVGIGIVLIIFAIIFG